MSPSVTTTQSHLKIAQIRKSVVYLKDGSVRQVIGVSPINFSLKEEKDQKGTIAQFQNFLNALDFPIQITVHSRRIDISPYLDKLEKYVSQTSSGLLEMQGRDYLQFVRKLTEIVDIMEKKFYVIVPFHPSGVRPSGGFFARLLGSNRSRIQYSKQELARMLQGVRGRATTVANSLGGMGMETKILNTQELIELYYKFYNPEEGVSERLSPETDLNADLVQSITEKGRQATTNAGVSQPSGSNAAPGGAPPTSNQANTNKQIQK